MKHKFKIVSVFSLIAVFFVSTLMCCCFLKTVEATEVVASCHQTSKDQTIPNNDDNDECQCNASLAVLQENISFHKISIQPLVFNIEQFLNTTDVVIFDVAYQAPPDTYDTSPLYIKYSVLRI